MRQSCIDHPTSSIGLSAIRVILYTMSLTAATSFFLIFIYLLCSPIIPEVSTDQINNRPIIGILAQEPSFRMRNAYGDRYNSYIAASYVKFAEGAGARVVPIWIGKTPKYYASILSKINGVIFPGGNTDFDHNNGYAASGAIIYDLAKQYNDDNHHFPILGICLGFELLTYLEANRVEHRVACSSRNQALPLEFKSGFNSSKLFKDIPPNIKWILETKNVTANFHIKCINEKALRSVGLTDKFHVTSVNYDKNGLRFISSLEHTEYPFYGLQFHPEKNLYEWNPSKNIPHGESATLVAQYFANFFVEQTRRSRHKFPSNGEELSKLIYNYNPTFTGDQEGSSFDQCYFFNN